MTVEESAGGQNWSESCEMLLTGAQGFFQASYLEQRLPYVPWEIPGKQVAGLLPVSRHFPPLHEE